MGVTSSGLLDEEIVDATGTGSQTEIDSPDDTLMESGQNNSMASDMLGHAAAGTPLVNYRGPCIYYLP